MPAACILTVLLEELGLDTLEMQRAATTYAAFLDAAFDPQTATLPQLPELRPPLAPEDILGSDDCFGRACGPWAPASAARSSATFPSGPLQPSIAPCRPPEITSPRAWASTLLGIHEYFRRLQRRPAGDSSPRHARPAG